MGRGRMAVLVMSGSLAPEVCDTRLRAWLGEGRCAELQSVMLRRTARWAADTAPGAAFVAVEAAAREPAGLPGEVRCFVHRGESAAERLEAAARHVFDEAGGAPLLIVNTDLPALGEYHSSAARHDFATGCEVVLGVAIGGGLYLLGMRSPRPELFAVAAHAQDGESTRRHARRVTDELGLDVGMLHYERALVTPADARAMLADPLLPAEVAAALGGRSLHAAVSAGRGERQA